MKYIDAEKLKAEIDKLHDAPVPKHDQQCDFSDGYSWGLSDIENLIDSLQQEQESIAEKFARIVRGNLIGIDEEVQQKFENLYFEIIGNKMYGGYND